MSDLNIVNLKREAGCVERCQIRVQPRGFMVRIIHTADLPGAYVQNGRLVRELDRFFDARRAQWVAGMIEWLRGLKHD